MAEVIEKTGKTVDEAFQAALEELGVSEDKVTMEIIEEPSKKLFGLFGSKPAKVRVTLNDGSAEQQVAAFAAAAATVSETEAAAPVAPLSADSVTAVERGKDFLANIFRLMNMEVQLVTTEVENGVKINLVGENLGILIGKHGQTLDALQYLANLAVNRGIVENKIRIIIDIEDYRERREETLVNLANRLAEKAKRTGRKIMLEPMNRHERKIIHMALQGNDKISTYSAGDEPYRKVVIEPRFRERYNRYNRYDRGSRYERENTESAEQTSEAVENSED